MSNDQNLPEEEIDYLKNLLNNRQFSNAIKKAETLTKYYPMSFVLWNLLGVSFYENKKFNDAIKSYQKAVSINPKFVHAYNNLGITLGAQGKLNKAIDNCKKAVLIEPNNALSYNNLGYLYTKQHKFDEAIAAYKKALLIQPNYVEVYNNLGVALREIGKYEECINAYKKAMLLQKDYAEPYNNLGAVLRDQGKLDEALDFCKRSISIQPDYPDAYNNLSIIFRDNENFDKAIEASKKAISLKPDYAEAYFALSFSYSLKGDLKKGLRLYEWRLKKDGFSARIPRKQLIWNGKDSILDKKFFVYEEQGLGDTIQFCRYLPLLQQKGAEVIFKVNTKMHALLETLDKDITLVDSDQDERSIDFETPLISLPYLFNTDLNSIPSMTSYLSVDKNRVISWKKHLPRDSFKVGICWQGSKTKIDFGRSFPLTLFEDISKLPNIELISLYKGEGEKQIEDINFDLTVLGNDFDNGEDAFIDSAAVIANCDLIITSDTAIAHLAGALGCRTWVVLKKIPDWRWMLDRNDSPWYPNMKLYRQKERDNWEEVFETIKKDLQSLITLNEN